MFDTEGRGLQKGGCLPCKDDRRDAFVLADSLRTDRHCFHAVALDEPALIRLRELSRLEDEIGEELNRATNRLREQFHRFFPQLLQLCESADEPWLWALFELAPSPARAAKLAEAKIACILREHRIRLISALREELAAPAEGQSEHRDATILLYLPGLGRKVAATMLSEASQAIAERDYHALRCYSGSAPITHQSGKKKVYLLGKIE
jgi:transposase